MECYHFPPNIVGHKSSVQMEDRFGASQAEAQRQQLITALQQTAGNRTETVRLLGVTRVTVWNRMKRFGIRLTP